MKFGTMELLVILLVVIIIFGPTQIPKLTKMLGKSIKGFRDGMDSEAEEPAAKASRAGDEGDEKG